MILNQLYLCCLLQNHKAVHKNKWICQNFQYSSVFVLIICLQVIFVKGSTQMRLPIVFKFIIYTKSFSASLVPKMQWTPWFHLMWSEAVLLAGVSWGDGRTIPGCCSSLSSCFIHSYLPKFWLPSVLVHLGLQPGGRHNICSYSLDYSPQSSPGQWTSDYLLCATICMPPV